MNCTNEGEIVRLRQMSLSWQIMAVGFLNIVLKILETFSDV